VALSVWYRGIEFSATLWLLLPPEKIDLSQRGASQLELDRQGKSIDSSTAIETTKENQQLPAPYRTGRSG
jgi:hypothetical protein